jgi:transposase
MVIADNAAYHTSGKVQDFGKQSEGQVTLGYLPRYAPELNRDEQVWNHAKARLAKLLIDTKDTLQRSLLSILRSIQKQAHLIRCCFSKDSTAYAADAWV